ncbi:MAG: hypothetical protein O7D95_02990 [Betaproteobacteria bacterium]|nr:hypothetical protein [Betaproteobacteria bacterium]
MVEFTTEQLKAVERVFDEFNTAPRFSGESKRLFMQAITGSNPVFNDGEVVVHQPFDDDDYPIYSDSRIKNCRSLKPSEVPLWEKDKKALEIAIERLEYLAKINLPGCTGYAQTALDDIKKLL